MRYFSRVAVSTTALGSHGQTTSASMQNTKMIPSPISDHHARRMRLNERNRLTVRGENIDMAYFLEKSILGSMIM